jgi:flagellar biogenesis protein FliO
MGPYGSYLVETVVMLVVVSALAFFAMVLAKRVGVGRAHGPIELVGQLPLDARRGLYLVKVGSRVFLVGVGEGGFSKLGEVPANEVPVGEKNATGFADIFARALNKKPKVPPAAPKADPGETISEAVLPSRDEDGEAP